MEQAAIKFSAAVTTNQCQDEYSKDCTHKLKFKFKLRCSYCSAQLHNSVAPKSYSRYVNAIYWCEYVEAVRSRESCCIYLSVVTFFMESVNCIRRDGKRFAKATTSNYKCMISCLLILMVFLANTDIIL